MIHKALVPKQSSPRSFLAEEHLVPFQEYQVYAHRSYSQLCIAPDYHAKQYYYYYYWYSALGPVWAETRVQSGDWYGSGTLHPGQVLRGSLPLLSPAFQMFPLFTTRYLHVPHDV